MKWKRKLFEALSIFWTALAVVAGLASSNAWSESVAPSASPIPASEDTNPDAFVTTLFLNSHETEQAQAGETLSYRFTPTADGDYLFRSFPQDGETPATSIRLIRESDGTELASSYQTDTFRIDSSLTAGETYRLDILCESSGDMAVEVMLNARGRCFDDPISLPSESIRYAKTIVHSRDTHWFSFVAPTTGLYSIRTEQSGDRILDTCGYLLDASGRTLVFNDDILFPGDSNFMLQAELTAGETYFIRINAFSNLTGAYRLVLTVPEDGQVAPESVALSSRQIAMNVNEEYALIAQVQPENALPELVYASSNQSVVTVEPSGVLRARSAGEATVWVYSYGGLADSCLVTVYPIEATGLSLAEEEVALYVGENARLTPLFQPSDATDRSVQYESSDETVCVVDSSGWLTAVSKGEAIISVTALDGGFTASATVRVSGERPVYRALVLGEYSYQDETRVGGENTVQGVADMLSGQSIDGGSYRVTLMTDSSRMEIEEGIRAAFAGASESDVSLLYINCHGAYEDGVAFLRLHDEDRITVDELAELLDPIPGKIVLLLDFCQSGAFIGRGGEFEQFVSDSVDAFSSETPLTNEKYIVLASAGADEDSYRRSFSSASTEDSTAAIMGRSLCEGAGWDLIYDRSVALKADVNRDRSVTVQEIYEYTRDRVMHYLKGADVTQTVYLYPENDETVIFGRN